MVAEQYRRGQGDVAKLAEQFRVTKKVIWADLAAIRKQWKTDVSLYFQAARAEECQKVNAVEYEAWMAWEKSKLPKERKRITSKSSAGPTGDDVRLESGGLDVTETTESTELEGQCGDPRFLEVVGKCIVQRRAILGLDAPVKVQTENPEENDIPAAIRAILSDPKRLEYELSLDDAIEDKTSEPEGYEEGSDDAIATSLGPDGNEDVCDPEPRQGIQPTGDPSGDGPDV